MDCDKTLLHCDCDCAVIKLCINRLEVQAHCVRPPSSTLRHYLDFKTDKLLLYNNLLVTHVSPMSYRLRKDRMVAPCHTGYRQTEW